MYDPFSGRGTTVIEAGLLGRSVISNDAKSPYYDSDPSPILHPGRRQ